MTHTSTEQPEALPTPEAVMDQAQVFASAWALYGSGSILEPEDSAELAAEEKEKLAVMVLRLHARITDLEAQLSAIGAGGVEPLRKQVVPETLVVPDGYALMPIEPTTGICKAAADGWLDCGSKMVLNKAGAAYRSSVAYFMKKGTQS